MTQDEKKIAVARAALDHVQMGSIIGVGTGSTVNHFIEALASIRNRLDGAVASSEETARRLRAAGISVLDLNEVDNLPLYVDGADEATRHRQLIKGGGGALTREKIVAEVAKRFVCIVDDSKLVDVLGGYPVPIEVIAMARSYIARRLVGMGGNPVLRAGKATDNGNPILDVHNLDLTDPARMESELNQIPGIVCNGIFARRRADALLVATNEGVESLG